MDAGEFRQILALGHELADTEFKGPGSCHDKHLRAKVIRAMLGMANRRDGGRIIIGVDDQKSKLDPRGIGEESDRRSWTHDNLSDAVRNFADPSITFSLTHFEVNGSHFVEIRVSEFAELPVVCRNSFDDHKGKSVLRRGAIYVRTHGKAESAEIATAEDMRAVLDLAVERGVRRFIERAYGAGLSLAPRPTGISADEAFAAEAAGDYEDELAQAIQSRGYWRFVVRPTNFSPDLIPITGLIPLVEKAQVRLRGWYLPHITRGDPGAFGLSSVGMEPDVGTHREV